MSGIFFLFTPKRSIFAPKHQKRTGMKKIYLAYLLLIALLSACGGKDEHTAFLSGEIKGIGTDTLYIYGMDRLYDRMDTLPVNNGKFSASLAIDTLVGTWLLLGNGTEYPLFLNKGDHIKIEGDTANLRITGNKPNEALTTFLKELKETDEPSEATLQQVEAFIESHPASLASIYLLEKFFVQKPQPDFERIRKMTEKMTGELKDRPYVSKLLQSLQEEEKVSIGKNIPYFRLPNAEGTPIARTNFKDRYLLIHFWASWDQQSMESNAALRPIYRKEQKNKYSKFALWGISLDTDREKWEKALRQDSLEWEQCCDFAGWNTETVTQLAIHTLPANLLISPSGKIEGRNLSDAEIRAKVEQITQKEKEKKEAEKKKR